MLPLQTTHAKPGSAQFYIEKMALNAFDSFSVSELRQCRTRILGSGTDRGMQSGT